MRQKYKATPFTRFLLFMLLFAPLTYIGVSYYKGEDGLENIKSLVGKQKTQEEKIEELKVKIQYHENEVETLKKELLLLQAK